LSFNTKLSKSFAYFELHPEKTSTGTVSQRWVVHLVVLKVISTDFRSMPVTVLFRTGVRKRVFHRLMSKCHKSTKSAESSQSAEVFEIKITVKVTPTRHKVMPENPSSQTMFVEKSSIQPNLKVTAVTLTRKPPSLDEIAACTDKFLQQQQLLSKIHESNNRKQKATSDEILHKSYGDFK